ncbi:MAG: molybdate ABC transporter substrate-binding protein [Nostocaceae cyanobacterium]|nr:molybdate ABC transporter substrate-binding protein [Nostocaceae cyanobacterium]
MKNRPIFSFLGWLLLSLTLVIGCSPTSNNNSSPTSTLASESANLTISAAASLKDAMEQIKPLYEQKKPNIKLTYNFGGSGSLQQQIEQGAPVDIFISAATKQMDALEKKGLLLDNTRKNLLKNEIVLIVPKNATGIKDFLDLNNQRIQKIAMGEPKSVPAGQYTQEVLTNLNIFEQVKPKAIFARDVRQALNYVETGNVDAGIVYLSDAKSSSRVKIVATAPATSHSPVVYPIAALKTTKNPKVAQDLIDFISSNRTKTVFENQGFKLAN